MIIGIADGALLIGLSRGNLRLLEEDKPIMATADDPFGSGRQLRFAIVFGETEDLITERLRQAGLFGPLTITEDRRKPT